MIPYERHELIVRCLEQNGIVKINDLLEELPDVSASTLRRDLKELERAGRVEHLTGGAVKLITARHEVDISERAVLYGPEKETIAKLAAAEVEDGDTVYVDSGSTCDALLRLLLDRKVTIYTTDAMACSVRCETVADLVVVGGSFTPVNSSFVGSMTESILRDLYFDKAFVGINAVDEDRGIMTPKFEEAAKKRIVRENSAKTYVLADSSKFHETANVHVFGLDGIVLISDKRDEKIARNVCMVTP